MSRKQVTLQMSPPARKRDSARLQYSVVKLNVPIKNLEDGEGD